MGRFGQIAIVTGGLAVAFALNHLQQEGQQRFHAVEMNDFMGVRIFQRSHPGRRLAAAGLPDSKQVGKVIAFHQSYFTTQPSKNRQKALACFVFLHGLGLVVGHRPTTNPKERLFKAWPRLR